MWTVGSLLIIKEECKLNNYEVFLTTLCENTVKITTFGDLILSGLCISCICTVYNRMHRGVLTSPVFNLRQESLAWTVISISFDFVPGICPGAAAHAFHSRGLWEGIIKPSIAQLNLCIPSIPWRVLVRVQYIHILSTSVFWVVILLKTMVNWEYPLDKWEERILDDLRCIKLAVHDPRKNDHVTCSSFRYCGPDMNLEWVFVAFLSEFSVLVFWTISWYTFVFRPSIHRSRWRCRSCLSLPGRPQQIQGV